MIVQINAGPGSGKTYTAKNCFLHQITRLPLQIKTSQEQEKIFDFVATNFKFPKPKSVAYFCLSKELKDRMRKEVHKDAEAWNFHGFGQSQLIKRFGFQQLDNRRTESFIEDITGQRIVDMGNTEKWYWLACKKLIGFLKQEWLEPTEMNKEFVLLKYPEMYNYHLPVDWQERCTKLMNLSSVPNRKVEWEDMVWLAAKKLQKINKKIYSLGYVDESQDNSAMTLALMQASCENLIFFGDGNQAINAFSGADHLMYEKIQDMADHVFPLKQTFRCPPHICEKANQIRPGGVIPGPNDADGDLKTITTQDMQRMLVDLRPERAKGVPNTLILARTNASIIACALRLLTADPYVECHIPNKDLFDTLQKFVFRFKVRNFNQLYERLDEEKDRAAGMKNTIVAMNILDTCITVEYFMEQTSDMDEMFDLMKSVLHKTGGHKLLTLHAAKGLEAPHIFILNPPVEHPLALKHPIASQQEYNLHFVGVTRSMLNLYYVK